MLRKLAIRAKMLGKDEFADVPTAAPVWREAEEAMPFRCIPEHVGQRAIEAVRRNDRTVLADLSFWFPPATIGRILAAFGGERPDILPVLVRQIAPEDRFIGNWTDPSSVEIVLVVVWREGHGRIEHMSAIRAGAIGER